MVYNIFKFEGLYPGDDVLVVGHTYLEHIHKIDVEGTVCANLYNLTT